MNKTEFVQELCKKTGLSEAESTQVNQIFEDNMFIGKKHTEKIISEIADKLGTDKERAEVIYRSARDIIGTAITDKLKHPFGGNKK